MKNDEIKATPVISVGVMTSANSAGQWGFGKLVAKECERAMSDAVTQALAEGISITDSDEIRRRILAARQGVLDRVKVPVQS